MNSLDLQGVGSPWGGESSPGGGTPWSGGIPWSGESPQGGKTEFHPPQHDHAAMCAADKNFQCPYLKINASVKNSYIGVKWKIKSNIFVVASWRILSQGKKVDAWHFPFLTLGGWRRALLTSFRRLCQCPSLPPCKKCDLTDIDHLSTHTLPCQRVVPLPYRQIKSDWLQSAIEPHNMTKRQTKSYNRQLFWWPYLLNTEFAINEFVHKVPR